jgi:uncharacterized protein
VDSTFLLAVAAAVLPRKKLLAVTAVSETYPEAEQKLALDSAKLLGVRHTLIRTKELGDRRFTRNSRQRCYYCKKSLAQALRAKAGQENLRYIADASNVTDKSDFRPGRQALKESGVRSPLAEAGLSKEDIRRESRRLGLKTWNAPSKACLASRIPYGTAITIFSLRRIETAEAFLEKLGFSQSRVRDYGALCRIEVLPRDFNKLIKAGSKIAARMKRLGFVYVTMDLEGYRTGSMNESLEAKPQRLRL